jgi:hypothetical protein
MRRGNCRDVVDVDNFGAVSRWHAQFARDSELAGTPRMAVAVTVILSGVLFRFTLDKNQILFIGRRASNSRRFHKRRERPELYQV